MSIGPTMQDIGEKLAALGNEIHRLKTDMAEAGDLVEQRLEDLERQITEVRGVLGGLHEVLDAIVIHLQEDVQ